MKVLLRRDVGGVGRRGDVVDVADGYARNYLFPEGLGIAATRGGESQAVAMRRARDLREAKDHEAAEAKAHVLGGATLQVSARAGSTGRLFGSVGAAEILEAARTQKGVELDRHHVALDEPIKALGSYEVVLRLAPDVEATAVVEVTAAD